MRIAASMLLASVALAGCGDRRSFDQRYGDTSSALANEARALDANLAADNLAEPLTANRAVPAGNAGQSRSIPRGQ
jgi:hypothetical protein